MRPIANMPIRLPQLPDGTAAFASMTRFACRHERSGALRAAGTRGPGATGTGRGRAPASIGCCYGTTIVRLTVRGSSATGYRSRLAGVPRRAVLATARLALFLLAWTLTLSVLIAAFAAPFGL